MVQKSRQTYEYLFNARDDSILHDNPLSGRSDPINDIELKSNTNNSK